MHGLMFWRPKNLIWWETSDWKAHMNLTYNLN